MRTLPVLALFALGACTNPASYGMDAASAACSVQEECNDNFDAVFDSVSECATTLEPVFGGSCYLDHCDSFDLEQGTACIDAINTATCEDQVSFGDGACSGVWSDCSQLELVACLAANALGGDE